MAFHILARRGGVSFRVGSGVPEGSFLYILVFMLPRQFNQLSDT